MFSDILFGLVVYGALLVFYLWNEPKAREKDRKYGPQYHFFNFGSRNK